MNELSWLLYLASVLGNLQSLFDTCGVILIITAITWAFFGSCATEGDCWQRKAFIRWQIFFVVMSFLCGVVSTILPDQKTVYLIAASEMGGQAVQTPEFQKVRAVVNHFLDDQLKAGDNGNSSK